MMALGRARLFGQIFQALRVQEHSLFKFARLPQRVNYSSGSTNDENHFRKDPNPLAISNAADFTRKKELTTEESSDLQTNETASDDSAAGDGTLELSELEIQHLSKGDEEVIRKIKLIQMEHELGRQEGMRVPSKIKLNRWNELLALTSRSGRRKFFEYLWTIEMRQLSDQRKKREAQERRSREFVPHPSIEEDPYWMVYGLTRNTIFLRLYDQKINNFYHGRVASAMMVGQPLIIDCAYDEHMTPREAKNCAGQIEYLLSDNRQHADPMDIHLCNARPDSNLMKFLLHRIPILYSDEYCVNITEKSYLDLFPKRELIYLSPHAREELLEYSEDEIYIIGAMVDKSDPRPYSMAKAKKEGLRLKKLPLSRNLEFTSGSGKSLTINQMGNIMLDVRYTRDWTTALRHVPTRKLRRYDEDEVQEPRGYQRREKPSQVLTDFELMSKRKGFKGFSANRVPARYPHMKTIMNDN